MFCSILYIFYLLVLLVVLDCATSSKDGLVLRKYDHDQQCFTQGLVLHNNIMYESCGLNGKSSIRIVNYKTGEVVKDTKLERKYFAEGIALHNNQLFMLTWKNKQMLIFDAKTLQQTGQISYDTHTGEGWGLTFDGTHLLASDGSNRITVFAVPADTQTTKLTVIKQIIVKDPNASQPIKHINDLQYLDGFIYANVWYRDIILKIDRSSGLVVQTFDLSTLYPHATRTRRADCLNGIAHNAADGTFFLTGKLWPHLYSVNLSTSTVTMNPDL